MGSGLHEKLCPNASTSHAFGVGTDSKLFWPKYLESAWTYLEKKLVYIMRDNIFTRNLPAEFGIEYGAF